jgi:hypothetical protein
MKRLWNIALAVPLVCGVAAFAPTAIGQDAVHEGTEDDWGFEDRDDDWELGDDTVRDDRGWRASWGDDEWQNDDYGRFDGDVGWDVDDPGYEDWYGESDDFFDLDMG